MPLVDKIEKESKGKVKFERLEVWHNTTNLNTLRKFKKKMKIACGDPLHIPIFYYEKDKTSLCGENSYETLKKWLDSLR